MRLILSFLFVCVLAFAGQPFVPAFESMYVARADGYAVQGPFPVLPTPATVEALALRFGAKIEVALLIPTPQFIAVVLAEGANPYDPWTVQSGKPAIQRSLVFAKGAKLPNGYVLQSEVKIFAWFFADAFARNTESALPGYAAADCWKMVENHDKDARGEVR